MQKNCIWEGITLHLSRLDLRGSSAQKAEDGARLFTVRHDRRMGDNKHKLKQEKFKADIRKTFFIFSTFSFFFDKTFLQWSRLPKEAVQTSSSWVFSIKPRAICSDLIVDLLNVSAKLNYPVIP